MFFLILEMEYYGILSQLHKLLGSLTAKLNWALCSGTDSHKEGVFDFRRKISTLKKRIHDLVNNSGDILNDGLLSELNLVFEREKEEIEASIALEFQPVDIVFNEEALKIFTDKLIPYDVRVGLSFGYKFLFPYSPNGNNLYKLLAQLEMTIEKAVPHLSGIEASFEIQQILKKCLSTGTFYDVLTWLKFVSLRSALFFENNPDIIAIKSDKGGHTVVMNLADYNAKLEQHLSDGVYVDIRINPLQFLIGRETELVDQLLSLPVVSRFSGKFSFQPNILSLPKFYGLPKIHKPGIPLRPILSMINSPGYFLGKLFYQLLDIVFPRSEHHIVDVYDFIKFIGNVNINLRDILVSFDVVSMYTRIPFEMVFNMIMRRSDEFESKFGINKRLLTDILIFLLEECSVFEVLDRVFKQKDGLPMGSCLSPLVARIFMDEVIASLLDKIPVSFIKVFVDDTIASIRVDKVDDALAILNAFAPGQVEFTLERENAESSINFLNVTLTRRTIESRPSIITNWFRKPFASGRLLNFYSSHKRATIFATGAHFIKTVLLLSDPSFFHENRDMIIDTLRLNSFPEIAITTLMNTCYTFMRPVNRLREVSDNQYIIFPHAIDESNKIRKTINRLKSSEFSLADSVRNTKVNFVKTIKSKDSIASAGNVVLTSSCRCGQRCIIGATKHNESGGMARKRLLAGGTHCSGRSHSFRNFDLGRGLYYNHQTQYLLRYTQYMYRHKLDATSCPYHFPLYTKFSDLVGCKCCK